MKRIINISLLLMLILTMGIWNNCVYAQDMFTDYFDPNDSDEEVKEYDAEENASIYKHNSPLGVRYTKKHPLVIVGNWSFKPFSFYNDHGEPDGFQVDILKHIFSRLHVPYTLQLMDWKEAKQMVRDGRAQLMVSIDKNDVSLHTAYSTSTLTEYKIGVMHRVETPKIRSILLLTEKDTLYVMHGDYVCGYLKQYFGETPPFHIEEIGSDEALQKVYDGRIKYFAWGYLPLKNIVRQFCEEDEIRVDDIDIPSGRMRFFCSDSILLHELDLQFQHLKSMQLYESVCQKWFVNDGMEQPVTTPARITFIVFAVIFLVVLIIAFFVIQRGSNAVNLCEEFQTISDIAVDMTHCYVLCLESKKMWVSNVSGNILPDDGLSLHDYEQLIHPDDIQKEYDIRQQIDNGEKDIPAVMLRMRIAEKWRTMSVSAIIRFDHKGSPRRVYLVLTDETEHIAEQMKLDTTLREFSDITEITELGIIYYDVNGEFISCNHSIIDTLDKGGLGRAEQYLRNTHLQDFPVILNGIVIERDMNMWFCAPVDITELNLHITIEARIRSVYDENGTVRGYEICIVDIDDKRAVYVNGKILRKRMAHAKKMLTRSHMELRFILRCNKISTFRWRKGNNFFEVSHDLLSFDRRVQIQKSFNAIIADDKSAFAKAIDNPEEYFSVAHQDIICFRKNGSMNEKLWLQIITMPDYDDKGNLIGAFGIQCDITAVQQSLENLRRETEKAESSGRLKTIFLANMTHELRTPLNAVNGFAQVMMFLDSAVHSTGSITNEKMEYISVMRHNCTMLINLVDNILQLSIMDTDGIKFHPRNVDFAQLFPVTICEMQKYILSPDVKLRLDTPYSTLPLEMDYERVIQVIDAFVNNAAKFTKKGFIHVGYRYLDGVLTIYVRDTGCGIPEDKQAAVFERFIKLNDFVQGTGLGLSVSKMIADHMGATIDLYSKEGIGSTLSFNLPCR